MFINNFQTKNRKIKMAGCAFSSVLVVTMGVITKDQHRWNPNVFLGFKKPKKCIIDEPNSNNEINMKQGNGNKGNTIEVPYGYNDNFLPVVINKSTENMKDLKNIRIFFQDQNKNDQIQKRSKNKLRSNKTRSRLGQRNNKNKSDKEKSKSTTDENKNDFPNADDFPNTNSFSNTSSFQNADDFPNANENTKADDFPNTNNFPNPNTSDNELKLTEDERQRHSTIESKRSKKIISNGANSNSKNKDTDATNCLKPNIQLPKIRNRRKKPDNSDITDLHNSNPKTTPNIEVNENDSNDQKNEPFHEVSQLQPPTSNISVFQNNSSNSINNVLQSQNNDNKSYDGNKQMKPNDNIKNDNKYETKQMNGFDETASPVIDNEVDTHDKKEKKPDVINDIRGVDQDTTSAILRMRKAIEASDSSEDDSGSWSDT